PALDVGLDALLEQRQPELLEARDLALRESLEVELLERGPAPEIESVAELCCTLAGYGFPRLGEQRMHPVHVELQRLDSKQVPRRLGHEEIGPEMLAELGDEVLKRGRRRARRVLAPESIDQPVGGDRAARVDQEQCKQCALLRASELH